MNKIDLDKWASFRHFVEKSKVHSCLVSSGNEMIYEYHRNKKSQKKLYKINSVTKSITSCLIGIAIQQGLIGDVHTPIAHYFPSILKDQDNRKQLITVDHLLSMTAGFDWPELGEWNGWPQMIHRSNWVNYVLERPLSTNPGEHMNYNSGCSHLLIAILQKLTGTSAKSYADKNLFSIMGINDYLWHEDPQGINIGGFGLHMSISDMHKFGSLYLRNGVWNNKQVLSDEWITYTTRPNLLTYHHIGYYGRHWWAPAHSPEHPYYYAMGMGGQYICIDPTNEVVIALTCDTYGDTLIPLRAIHELLA